jgi:ABC-2 type transport system ATP-binding protein
MGRGDEMEIRLDEDVARSNHHCDEERATMMQLDILDRELTDGSTTTAVLERPLLRRVAHASVPELRAPQQAVVVRNVTKEFPRKQRWLSSWRKQNDKAPVKPVRALDDISLAVRRNEIFGILGANGSGKSTLIRVMSTLLIPDSGEIAVFGYDVREHEMQVKRLINRVSVEASFFKKLSAMENLLYAVRLYGRSGGDLRAEITAILVELGIAADRVGQPLEQMSRGMQQKVAIARAFLTSPVLLLLDEPTTGLDPRSKKDVQRFVNDLRDNHDATIIICTHDMDEAEQLCDRLAIMDQGRLIATGTVPELKQLVINRDGVSDPTMEDVFIALTGHDLNEDEEKAA